jgi:hypothetical protein
MPISLQYFPDDNALFPVFVCDCCGLRILNALEGAYLIPADALRAGPFRDVLIAHKEKCLSVLEAEHDGWEELMQFSQQLLSRSGLTRMLTPDYQKDPAE